MPMEYIHGEFGRSYRIRSRWASAMLYLGLYGFINRSGNQLGVAGGTSRQ